MSLQQQLCEYGQGATEPLPVLIKGTAYSVPALLVVPNGGLPLLTVRKPVALCVYQVKDDCFINRGTLTREQSYVEYNQYMKASNLRVFRAGAEGTILVSATEEECHAFIVEFLRLNPEPTDAQVHELATAIGIDKETLEAEIYKMLGHHIAAATDDELVLEDKKDPWRSPVKLAPLNDEGFDENMITEVQEDTYDDGVPGDE